MRVAIYTRVSQDVDGRQTATPRQERHCRLYAEAQGWEVIEVYEDVDLSAYAPRVLRPSYERLLSDVAARRVEGVLVWKIDRLVRRPLDFERFWSVCEKAGVSLASVTEPIDSSSELGLVIVRILVNFAQLEISTKRDRLRARFAEMAGLGMWHGGFEPFGYARGSKMQTVVPEEAELIRDGARRLLAGDSLRALVRDWNAQGWTGRTGAAFSGAAIRSIYKSHRLTGDATYHGEVSCRDAWPAILDRETAALVRFLLADPYRYSTAEPSRSLLRGLLICGRCGAALGTRLTGGRRSYQCSPDNGCGSMVVGGHLVDDWARAVVIWRSTAGDAPREVEAPTFDVGAATTQLAALARAHFIDKTLDTATYQRLRLEIDQNTPRPSRRSPGRENFAPVGWDSMQIEAQREHIHRVLHHITVRSPDRRSSIFDPHRLEPVFRTAPKLPFPERFEWQPPVPPERARTAESIKLRARTPGSGPPSRKWLTPTGAGQYLGVSTETIRRLVRAACLPANKETGRLAIRIEDVDEYLAGCRISPGTVASVRGSRPGNPEALSS